MDEIVAFAELEQFIDLPVRTYSSGMYMRLGFSVAAHIQADVLLLDEVFAVGDEQFQRKCFGKIAEFKNRGGTIVFVSHDAQAVERLCDRAVLLRQGEVAFDGSTPRGDRALPAAARRRREPGRARGRAARVGQRRGADRLGAAARRRRRRARRSSPPASRSTVRLVVAAEPASRRRASRSSCATTAGSCSAASRRRPRELGWDGGAGERELRFQLGRLPLADGRFHLRVALVDADGGRLLHTLDDALRFFVFPPATRPAPCCSTAAGRCRRSAQSAPTSAAVSSRACPDWPALMEVAPELQFHHYTLGEAQLPADAFVQLEGISSRRGRDLLRPRRHVFNPEHTDPRIVEALRGTHWIDLRELAAGRRGLSRAPAAAAAR